MATCDLCGEKCKAHDLVTLLDSYKIPELVEEICPSCEKWANKLKSDLLLEISPKMREAIGARKGMPPPQDPKKVRFSFANLWQAH